MTLGISGSGATFDTAGFAVTLAGVLSGPGSLTKIGSGTLTLAAANTYSGNTLVSAGTLQLGNPARLGTGGLTVTGGELDLNANSVSLPSLAGGIGGTISDESYPSGTPTTLTVAQVATTTFGGTIRNGLSGQPVALAITGSGTLTLTGPNTFTGASAVGGGKVVAGGTALGLSTLTLAATSKLTLAAPAAPVGLVSQYYNLVPVYNGYETIQANNALLDARTPALSALTITGANGAAGTDQRTTFDYGSTSSGGTTFPAPYGGSSAASFYVRWTGPLVISTAGTYTFYTDSDDGSLLGIDGSTVVFNNASQGLNPQSGSIYLTAGLHAMTVIYNQGGGDYAMNASIAGPGIGQETIPASMLQTSGLYLAGLQGSGQIDLAGKNLMVGWNDANTTFSGTIGDSVGTGQLLKAGDGTLTLAGSNTYTGLTTVAGGTLLATTTAALPGYKTSGKIIVAGGMVLAVQPGNGTAGWNASPIDTLRAGATWTSNTAALGIDTSNGNFTYGSNITQAMGLAKLGANILILTGSSTYSGPTTISGGTLQLGDGSNDHDASLSYTSGITNTAALVYNVFASQTANYTISGSGSLTKIGPGTLTLLGSNYNAYTGKTFLTSGTMAMNSANAAGLYEGLVSNGNNGADTTDPIPLTSIQPVARWGARPAPAATTSSPGVITPPGVTAVTSLTRAAARSPITSARILTTTPSWSSTVFRSSTIRHGTTT